MHLYLSPHFQLRPTPKPLSSRHSSSSSSSSRANLFAKDFYHLDAQTEDEQNSTDVVDVEVDGDGEIVSFASDMRTQEQEQINGSTDSFERSVSRAQMIRFTFCSNITQTLQ